MSGPYNVKQALLAAYRHLLTPLVRVLLRNGISYLEFAEVARQVFVDVAGRDFTLPKRKISLSRIAIMTGLSRKEAARLAREGAQIKRISQNDLTRVGRVLQGWYTDSDFTGPYGVPLDLKFEDGPRKQSFSQLVRRYSGDMPARAMLDELVRVGSVRIEQDTGLIRVLNRAYIPEKLAPENIRYFGEIAHGLIDTLEGNLRKSGPGRGRFERRVVADDGLRKEDLKDFDVFIRERGLRFLVEIDDWITARPKPTAGEEKVSTGVGLFHYITNDRDDQIFAEQFEGEQNDDDEEEDSGSSSE